MKQAQPAEPKLFTSTMLIGALRAAPAGPGTLKYFGRFFVEKIDLVHTLFLLAFN